MLKKKVEEILSLKLILKVSREELFFAIKGKGTHLNDKKIKVSGQKDLTKATVATDNSYIGNETKENLSLFLSLPSIPWITIKGSAVLTMCEISCGRIDLYFHAFLKPWDNAAAFLIVKESGGIIKGWKGENINFLSPKAIVGNRELVYQFLKSSSLKDRLKI